MQGAAARHSLRRLGHDRRLESLALDADQELLIERLINNLTLNECGQVNSLVEVEILARSCQSG